MLNIKACGTVWSHLNKLCNEQVSYLETPVIIKLECLLFDLYMASKCQLSVLLPEGKSVIKRQLYSGPAFCTKHDPTLALRK